MNISIRQMDAGSMNQVDAFDLDSIVNSHLVLHVEDDQIAYSIISVPPYKKILAVEPEEYASFTADPRKAIFFADVDGKPVGQIKLLPWWNKFAYIEELAVNTPFRSKGVGSALLKRGIEWARTKNFPGIMLETQNNNVPACKLYEKCGFTLGGFDLNVYKNFPQSKNEIVLYWYLIFDS